MPLYLSIFLLGLTLTSCLMSSSAVKVQEFVKDERGIKNVRIINNTPYVAEITLSLSKYGFNVNLGNNNPMNQNRRSDINENLFTEKPEVIVGPLVILGEVSEAQKKILKNALSETLNEDFRVVSNERFESSLRSHPLATF